MIPLYSNTPDSYTLYIRHISTENHIIYYSATSITFFYQDSARILQEFLCREGFKSFYNLSSKLNYFSLCLYLYDDLAILKIISMTEGTFHGT